MQERQGVLDGVDFASDEALQEGVRRTLKDGTSKDGGDSILDVGVERVDGGVERGSRSVDPSKDTVVNGGLDAIDTTVDIIYI